jgi:hypothetical protein
MFPLIVSRNTDSLLLLFSSIFTQSPAFSQYRIYKPFAEKSRQFNNFRPPANSWSPGVKVACENEVPASFKTIHHCGTLAALAEVTNWVGMNGAQSVIRSHST